VAAARLAYKAEATHYGTWWLLSVPDVPGALTPMARLEDGEMAAREVIAIILNVPNDSFDVTVVPKR
jgi:hypothetical protein